MGPRRQPRGADESERLVVTRYPVPLPDPQPGARNLCLAASSTNRVSNIVLIFLEELRHIKKGLRTAGSDAG